VCGLDFRSTRGGDERWVGCEEAADGEVGKRRGGEKEKSPCMYAHIWMK